MGQTIKIKRRTIGAGSPSNLELAELAYNTTGHVLYIGGIGNAVHLLVGSDRQLELTGEQTIVAGSKKTINIYDLILLGGNAGNYVQTDGNGNLTFAPAVSPAASLVPVTPAVLSKSNVQAALEALANEIVLLKARVAVLEGS
jgi:hypothetical protein